MTPPLDLDGLETLENKATPGKWWATTHRGIGVDSHNCRHLFLPEDFARTRDADAALIVALHNSFPTLLLELKGLREEVGRMREALEGIRDCGMLASCENCKDSARRALEEKGAKP